jgi:lipoprotein-anchoring transpeptidase ErfK/SrfK
LHLSKENSRGRKIIALLLLLLLGIAVWVWWQNQPILRPLPTKPLAVVPQTNQPPVKPTVVPTRTNEVPLQTKTFTNSPPAPRIPPISPTEGFPRPPRDVFEAQVALARRAISSGSLDGAMGSQTRAALLAFQRHAGLTETLELDAETRARLSLDASPLTTCIVTSNDLARLQPVSKTWLGKSQQTALDYETILELVAERGHASPNLIRRLNPGVDWTNVGAGTAIQIPDVTYPRATRAGFAVISLGEKKLEVFDTNTNLLAHFPCSIAARVEKRPAGELHVTAIAPNPDYTFNPEVFPESAEAREIKTKLILPPGPNNPVGTAWISLDKPGYGMHGTPNPEQVGRTESHGCFRLANWNAEYLIKLVWVGMPVYVEP